MCLGCYIQFCKSLEMEDESSEADSVYHVMKLSLLLIEPFSLSVEEP